MLKTLALTAIALFAVTLALPAASGQTTNANFGKKGYHYSKWGNQKGWEVVTVSGPSKMIFLSGVGAEDENSTGPTILHLGDFEGQCGYAVDKIKRILDREGASMDDIVKIVAYVTDIRSEADYGACLNEAFGETGRRTVHTFLNISQLAHPGMLLEIDVTAMVPTVSNHLAVSAQTASAKFEKKTFTISKWTKGSELVTVSGPSKMIFLSGVGAEDENSTGPTILHLGDPLGQCRYAEDKIKRLLERQGATMGDIVKVVAYTTDIRYREDIGKCEAEAFGDGPRPAVHTSITLSQLAHPGMLVELDVTAMEPIASGQPASFEKKNYNYSRWTPGRLSEVVTVSGPSKMIFLSGVGAEDENSTGPTILHLGDPLGQCRYAEDKIKRLLAREGASMEDIVKMVVYVTDIRSEGDLGKCETEAFGDAPRPAHTFLNISQLAHPGMLLELDVTAVVPQRELNR